MTRPFFLVAVVALTTGWCLPAWAQVAAGGDSAHSTANARPTGTAGVRYSLWVESRRDGGEWSEVSQSRLTWNGGTYFSADDFEAKVRLKQADLRHRNSFAPRGVTYRVGRDPQQQYLIEYRIEAGSSAGGRPWSDWHAYSDLARPYPPRPGHIEPKVPARFDSLEEAVRIGRQELRSRQAARDASHRQSRLQLRVVDADGRMIEQLGETH